MRGVANLIGINIEKHKYLMKTITFWLAETLAKEYKEISFFAEDELYVFDNEFTGERVYVDESINIIPCDDINKPTFYFKVFNHEKEEVYYINRDLSKESGQNIDILLNND